MADWVKVCISEERSRRRRDRMELRCIYLGSRWDTDGSSRLAPRDDFYDG